MSHLLIGKVLTDVFKKMECFDLFLGLHFRCGAAAENLHYSDFAGIRL